MRASRMLFVVSAGNGNEKGIGEDTDQKPDYPSWLRSWECRSVRSIGCTHKAKTPQGNSLVLIQTQWQNALFGDFEIDL